MANIATNDQELLQTARDAHDVLAKATAVFPFDLFPNSISVDREKVTITKRRFFMVGEEISTQIQDVLNVEADTGPFFGTVRLWTRFFSNQPLEITFLTRNDTIKIKEILQGYIIALKKEIDCSNYSMHELIPLLRRMGTAPI